MGPFTQFLVSLCRLPFQIGSINRSSRNRRAAEIIRENPELSHAEAFNQACREEDTGQRLTGMQETVAQGLIDVGLMKDPTPSDHPLSAVGFVIVCAVLILAGILLDVISGGWDRAY